MSDRENGFVCSASSRRRSGLRGRFYTKDKVYVNTTDSLDEQVETVLGEL